MVKETLDAPYSHYLLDAELSQKVDHRTTEEMDIDGFTLMEIAGSSAAKKILQHNKQLQHNVFLCGKGNNAGDALVVARYLLQHDARVTLVFISGTDDLSKDTQKNLKLLRAFDKKDRITIYEKWSGFSAPNNYNFIIDGMLGTGLTSDLRGDYAKAVGWANQQQHPVLAMDIPTGLHPDSGEKMGKAIEAVRTFSFGGRKQGFYLNDGPAVTGTIDYCDLPFPNAYKEDCKTFALDTDWVSLPSYTPGKHKYDSGVLHIVAGSEGLTGAAIMAARSAWAEGLGAIIIICPRGLLSVFEHNLPSVIKKPVGKKEDYYFKESHAEQVQDILQEKESSMLLGPGLGRNTDTISFVEQLLTTTTTDTIIDADGLWCLSQLEEWPKTDQANWILTPHPGELQKLIKDEIGEGHQRLNTVRKLCQENNTTILSKGMPGIIGTPSRKCYLTNYNTNYFARAGSGDVLAGKVSAFSALGLAADESCAAALLNGQQKLSSLQKDTNKIPEPTDFI
ncbi:NAD(P)H-hydrate epimerase [Fodinibius salinus]|uniref:Bifunctional NAD(P)H-hydrate repair enzyme n=1 Tax=Fodinibius salinus TaxID=860790 RepID=A0A5D3YJ49_9BACT|nr:NAD(P)H-hydrate dehydratase [Fodinibius salinus]TYP92530.1 NAD(P)H-hydrate epimerase [Fodinibius salinus]